MRKGFTLVELAIVIVIIGLLIGGVLAGKELVEQARIRSAIKEYQSITGAFVLFKDKYKAIPADITNASTYFSTCTPYVTGPCDGDGNGLYDDDWNTGDPSRFWGHLVLGKYLPDRLKPARPYYLSQSFPISTWWVQTGLDPQFAPTNAGTVATYLSSKNYLFFTGHINAISRDLAILTPTAASNIDEKIDDGMPQTGKVMAGRGATNNTLDCLGVGNTYLMSLDAVSCMMLFDLPN